MRIGFVVEGDNAIGMGHVVRCIALARAFAAARTDASVTFHTRPDTPAATLLRDAGIGTVLGDCPPDADLAGTDVLIVDRLANNPAWLRSLRRHCRCLVALDDTGPGHFVADLAINALYRPTTERPSDSNTDSRCGFEYMILDPAFAAVPAATRPRIENLFLTQGGADTWGVTAKLVTALAPWLANHPETALRVKTGPAFDDEAALQAALARIPGRWRRDGQPNGLAPLMAEMDAAITAGGVMAFELLAVGVPSLIVTDEDKELETAARLSEQGLAVNLGRCANGIGARLAAELDRMGPPDLRADIARRSRAAIDGRGVERIIAAVFDSLEKAQ